MSRSEERLRLLLIDDHALMREGLRVLLEREDDMEIVAEAASLAEFAATDPDVRVDLVVADLVLPDGRGAAVVKCVKERFPDAKVLCVTMVDNPADVHLVFAEGAGGYLLKEAASTELVTAVRRVAAGEQYLDPSMGAVLAAMRAAPTRSRSAARADLTPRELEIAGLLALGNTNAEIAAVLHVSIRTVEHHRSSIFRKLGIHSRAELVHYVSEHRLLPRT